MEPGQCDGCIVCSVPRIAHTGEHRMRVRQIQSSPGTHIGQGRQVCCPELRSRSIPDPEMLPRIPTAIGQQRLARRELHQIGRRATHNDTVDTTLFRGNFIPFQIIPGAVFMGKDHGDRELVAVTARSVHHPLIAALHGKGEAVRFVQDDTHRHLIGIAPHVLLGIPPMLAHYAIG